MVGMSTKIGKRPAEKNGNPGGGQGICTHEEAL